MTASEIRTDARKHLTGKWGKGALIILAYFLVAIVIEFITGLVRQNQFFSLIVSILVLLIDIPLSFGLVIAFMKLKRNEEVKAFDFINLGFTQFSRAWGIAFSMLGKLIVPIIICIIFTIISIFMISFGIVNLNASSGIISGYETVQSANSGIGVLSVLFGMAIMIATYVYIYIRCLSFVLSYNIAYDEPNMSHRDVVLKSETLMQGNKGKYFCLNLSFIGWMILASLTFGIGLFWVLPYIQVSTVCFYDNLNGNKKESIEE